MRAAASLAVSIILVGIYLVVAAALAFAPSVIALGTLAIAAAFAIGLVVMAKPADAA
jgi:hypothetical protein